MTARVRTGGWGLHLVPVSATRGWFGNSAGGACWGKRCVLCCRSARGARRRWWWWLLWLPLLAGRLRTWVDSEAVDWEARAGVGRSAAPL